MTKNWKGEELIGYDRTEQGTNNTSVLIVNLPSSSNYLWDPIPGKPNQIQYNNDLKEKYQI